MKSFLSGRSIASVTPLKSISNTPTASQRGSAVHDHSSRDNGGQDSAQGAQVECVKQGDKVVRLIVTCSCGERIEIDCVYPTGS